MSKFKVGDKVRVRLDAKEEFGYDFNSPGTEFIVTAVRGDDPDCVYGRHYYMGDPRGSGVWEKFLELAPLASGIEVTESSSDTYYYQPRTGSEWVFIHESQVGDMVANGFPVKRFKMTCRSETEYLS
jgi:hypothetical protein